jgi:hypothetical protein
LLYVSDTTAYQLTTTPAAYLTQSVTPDLTPDGAMQISAMLTTSHTGGSSHVVTCQIHVGGNAVGTPAQVTTTGNGSFSALANVAGAIVAATPLDVEMMVSVDAGTDTGVVNGTMTIIYNLLDGAPPPPP